jgi:hypothetical protein
MLPSCEHRWRLTEAEQGRDVRESCCALHRYTLDNRQIFEIQNDNCGEDSRREFVAGNVRSRNQPDLSLDADLADHRAQPVLERNGFGGTKIPVVKVMQ